MPGDTEEPPGSGDPGVVETVVVHAEDVVTAYEARARGGRRTVLRVTPPFSARMRARIHVSRPGEYDAWDGPAPIHVDPDRLLAETAPDYPEPDETAADIDGAVDPEAHHQRHRRVVAEWRERAAGHIRERVTVEADGRSLTVAVAVLGYRD